MTTKQQATRKTILYCARPKINSTFYPIEPIEQDSMLMNTELVFEKYSQSASGRISIKKLYSIDVRDDKGLYLDKIDGAPPMANKSATPHEKAALVAAQIISLAANSAALCVQKMDISDYEKDSRVKEIARRIKEKILFRGTLRNRSQKGFESLLINTLNDLVISWQRSDKISYPARIRRNIGEAYILALKATQDKNFSARVLNEGYQSQFITQLQDQTKEAALYDTTGYQKAAFVAIAYLIDECRRSGGRIGKDASHPDAEFVNGIDGQSLSVTPEFFLDVMGLSSDNRRLKSVRKNNIGKLLVSLRDRSFTLLAEDPSKKLVFTSRRNLFAFNAIGTEKDAATGRHGNDKLWIFSNLSALTLPINMKKTEAPWTDQYDKIPIDGMRHVIATNRSEIAQDAINIMWPILIKSSKMPKIYDDLHLSELGMEVYKKRNGVSRRKIFDAVKTGLSIDGRVVSFLEHGRLCIVNPKVQEEENAKRELAAETSRKKTPLNSSREKQI